MKPWKAIQIITEALNSDELIVSGLGFISRELFNLNDSSRNFYMLGGMGLAVSVGLGLALSRPNKKVVVLEGDGGVLMNLNTLALIGYLKPKNLIHIVLDNESYESTGGQPSITSLIGLEKIASAAGIPIVKKISNIKSLRRNLQKIVGANGPIFILIKVKKGRREVPRISIKPEKIKLRFINHIKSM